MINTSLKDIDIVLSLSCVRQHNPLPNHSGMALSREAVIGLVTLLIMCIPTFVLLIRSMCRLVHLWLPNRSAAPVLPFTYSPTNRQDIGFGQDGVSQCFRSLCFETREVPLYLEWMMTLEIREAFLMVDVHTSIPI